MPARNIPTSPAPQRYSPPAKRIKQWRRIARLAGQRWLTTLLGELEREHVFRMSAAQSGVHSSAWLMRYRPQFRRLDVAEPAAIRLYLLNCPETMMPLAIWLLGRCATRTKHFNLLEFALHSSPATLRHAARALRRVEAWEQLNRLEAAAPHDPRIAWYASAPTTKRVFRERLHNFAEHVDASHAEDATGPSRMALWFADVDWIRRPPKPVEYIRQVLQRIHRWVHGAD